MNSVVFHTIRLNFGRNELALYPNYRVAGLHNAAPWGATVPLLVVAYNVEDITAAETPEVVITYVDLVGVSKTYPLPLHDYDVFTNLSGESTIFYALIPKQKVKTNAKPARK